MTNTIALDLLDETDTITIAGQKGETALCAALKKGLPVRYHCSSGLCNTCQASLVEGSAEVFDGRQTTTVTVHAADSPVKILLCQLKPLDACRIQLPYALAKDSAPFLRPEYRQAMIRTVRHLSGNLYDLSLDLSQNFNFHPGQYSLIGLKGDAQTRAYSMAAHDLSSTRHRYIVACEPDGYLSALLCNSDAVGKQLSVFGPMGHCYLKKGEFNDIVMLVGGSGISVAMAALDWYGNNQLYEQGCHLHIYWGIRTLQDAQFLDELNNNARATKAQINLCYDDIEQNAPIPARDCLQFQPGNPVDVLLRTEPALIHEQTGVYLSGSSGFVDYATRSLMLGSDVNVTNIRSDSFA